MVVLEVTSRVTRIFALSSILKVHIRQLVRDRLSCQDLSNNPRCRMQ